MGDEGFDVVLACDVLYTPSAVDVIAPLVRDLVRGAGGRDKKQKGLFVLADPPGRFPENHARFLRLMAADGDGGGENDPSRAAVAASARADGETSRECLNLEGEPMVVDLTTYVIER